jgi:predicted Zn-dependent protease
MVVTIKVFIYIIFILFASNSYSANSAQLIRDAEIEFFFQRMINNIIKHSDSNNKKLYPRLILNETYNAFVVGTNKIYLHTGLVSNANSIDEIQGVLAHEIGHLLLKHHTTRLIDRKDSSKYSSIAAIAGIALGLSGNIDPNLATGLIIGGQDLAIKSQLQFTRGQETHADVFALEIMRKSEISYLGLEKLLIKLSEEDFLNRGSKSDYYRSHPFSQSRLDLLKRYKENLLDTYNETKYLLIEDKLISLKYINNKIKSYNSDPFKTINKKITKSDDLSRYSLIIAYLKTGNYDLAIHDLKLLIKENKNYPFYYELAGDIFFNKGDFDLSIQHFKKALKILKKNSNSSNTLIKISLAKSLLKKNDLINIKEAISVLEGLILIESNWSNLWRLIAQGYGKIGKKGITYIALAEESIIKRDFNKAQKYVDMALKDPTLPINYRLRGNDITTRIKNK